MLYSSPCPIGTTLVPVRYGVRVHNPLTGHVIAELGAPSAELAIAMAAEHAFDEGPWAMAVAVDGDEPLAIFEGATEVWRAGE